MPPPRCACWWRIAKAWAGNAAATCDAGGEGLRIDDAEAVPVQVPLLPEAAITQEDDGFGPIDGQRRERRAGDSAGPAALRYYDVERDYLAGLQRADGRTPPGREATIELPGALSAADARLLANRAAARARHGRDSLAWRTAELDPAVRPGSVVRAPNQAGYWRVASWEWRDHGVELELTRLPQGAAREQAADPGRAQLPPDLLAGPTALAAFELPWDGTGAGDTPRLFAALSSPAPGWLGAQIFSQRDGVLVPLGSSRTRATLGTILSPLPASPALLLERTASVQVRLAAVDLTLELATPEALAYGANAVLIGSELVQFVRAIPLGDGEYRLEGLLRGRWGTEAAAKAGQPTGSRFILLDHRLTALDPAVAGNAPGTTIAALGLADSEPVIAPLANPGLTRRPLTPVHPRLIHTADGALQCAWTRRARGAWDWPDGIETPLNEESETYVVGLGPADSPILRWETTAPSLTLSAATAAALAQDHSGQPLWVRQHGRFAQSDPLLIATIA